MFSRCILSIVLVDICCNWRPIPFKPPS